MVSSFTPSFVPTSYFDKLLPNNIEAEEAVLGGLLLNGTLTSIIADKLPVEAFYSTMHQQVYRAIINLYKQQVPVNMLTVVDYLEKRKQLKEVGVRSTLAELFNRTVSSVNIDTLSDLILDKYIRRKIIELGCNVMSQGYDSLGSTGDLLTVVQQKTLAAINSFPSSGEDAELHRYKNLIEAVREIELTISDPGYREFKMQALAKSYGRQAKEIERMYFKSLISAENEPLMSLEQLRQKYGSQIKEWLLHGFLPKGSTVLLHAKGGVGKTRLAYDFFYHLATGTAWSGFPVTAKSRRCLIVQTDEAPSDMLQALEDRGITESMQIRFKTRWLVDHIQQLRQEIAEFRPEIILIDSLTSVNRQSLVSENDTEYARPVLMLRDIAQEFGCTILIVHHSNSEGGSRGTKAIFNSVSEVWSLKRDEQNTSEVLERILTIEKSRSRAPAKYRLRFDPEDKSWACLGKEGDDPNAAGVTTKQQIVSFLLKNSGVPFQVEEIYGAVDGNLDHVRRCVFQLAEDGIISRKKSLTGKAGGRGYTHAYFIKCDENYYSDPPVKPKSKSAVSAESDHLTEKSDHIRDHFIFSTTTGVTEESDHCIERSDHIRDHFIFSTTTGVSAESDHPIAKTPPETFLENQPNLQTGDHFSPKPLSDKENKVIIPNNAESDHLDENQSPCNIPLQLAEEDFCPDTHPPNKTSVSDVTSGTPFVPAVRLSEPIKSLKVSPVGQVKAIAVEVVSKQWEFTLNLPDGTTYQAKYNCTTVAKANKRLEKVFLDWIATLRFRVNHAVPNGSQWTDNCTCVNIYAYYNGSSKTRFTFQTPEGNHISTTNTSDFLVTS